ncbi:hypothetical protein HK099_000495, partial [Clydaea vesicula]
INNKLISIEDYVNKYCPNLTNSTFYPTIWLLGGHLQTFWAAFVGDNSKDRVKYEREILTAADGGTISIDWTPRLNELFSDESPILIVSHGLTGGSHETYVHDLLYEALFHEVPAHKRPDLENFENHPLTAKFRCVVVNFRGCANTKLTSPLLYCGAYTDDLRLVVKHIHAKFPKAKLCGVGFSLGANIMTKYVGEEGVNCLFSAFVSVANPYDLISGALAMHRTWIGRNIYSAKMNANLKRVLYTHKQILESNKYDIDAIAKSKTITDFDAALTSIAFDYLNVTDYYRKASSNAYINHIRVPTLLLTAFDDPVAHFETIPWYEVNHNGYVVLGVTKGGGHIGWFSGGNMFLSYLGPLIGYVKKEMNMKGAPQRWFTKSVVEFVNGIVNGVDESQFNKEESKTQDSKVKNPYTSQKLEFLPSPMSSTSSRIKRHLVDNDQLSHKKLKKSDNEENKKNLMDLEKEIISSNDFDLDNKENNNKKNLKLV